VDLSYGRRSFPFVFDERQFQILAPQATNESCLSDAEIGSALDSPIESVPLEEMVKSGESVLIVVSDATRATASGQIVNLLVRRIIQSGVAPSDIAIIFATGIH